MCFSVVATTIMGCASSSKSQETTNGNQVESSSTEFPITIKHAFGETTITSQPERVVTLSWANQDAILALGVVPVGVSAANFGMMSENNLHLWTEEAFENLGETNPNVFNDETGWDYEAIAAAQPDIIVASYSGMTEEEYNAQYDSQGEERKTPS